MSDPFPLDDGLSSRVRLSDGHQMPILGLGVWRSNPGEETESAVSTALSHGYRLLDTATLYRNEADVGAALRRSGLPRDEVFITTKVWNDDQGYESTKSAFHASAKRLGLSEIDLYLIHWPMPGRRLETWKALRELKRDGLCRSIGVSNYSIAHLEELRASFGESPVLNQVELHPYVYDPELVGYCRSHRIQLEAYAPLTRGRRLGEEALGRIAAAHHVSAAQVLIRWGLQHGFVEIPKSVHRERILENAKVFGFELTDAEMKNMDGWNDGQRITPDPVTMP